MDLFIQMNWKYLANAPSLRHIPYLDWSWVHLMLWPLGNMKEDHGLSSLVHAKKQVSISNGVIHYKICNEYKFVLVLRFFFSFWRPNLEFRPVFIETPEIDRNDSKFIQSGIGIPWTKFLESPLVFCLY